MHEEQDWSFMNMEGEGNKLVEGRLYAVVSIPISRYVLFILRLEEPTMPIL